MTAYFVASESVGTRKADTMIVSAASLADAKDFCESQFQGDGAVWDGATYTELADVAGNADDALVGWRFRITVTSPLGVVVADVSHVGTDADDDMDAIAAALVILLNATASIDNSSFSTPDLIVASASVGDELGDHTVVATVMPPIISDDGGIRENDDVVIAGYIAAITHEGASTAALNVEYQANSYVRPTLYKRLVNGKNA